MHLLCLETSAYCSLLMPMIVFTIGRVVCCSCYSIIPVKPGCLNFHLETIELVCLSSVFESLLRDHQTYLLGFVWAQPTTEEVRHWPRFYLICQKKWWHLNSVWTSKLKHVIFFYCICIFLWCCIYLLRFVLSHLHIFLPISYILMQLAQVGDIATSWLLFNIMYWVHSFVKYFLQS